MRILFFILALANLLFFAYAQGYFGRPENPDAVRLEKQIQPEVMVVVSRGEPPAAAPPVTAPSTTAEANGDTSSPETLAEAVKEPLKGAPKDDLAKEDAKGSAKESNVCLAWGSLSSAEADRLSALVTEKFDDFRQTRKPVPVEGGAWWVFMPPQASKAEADKKASELKQLGVLDFFVIQDSGPNRWAISLGVFSAEVGANAHLAQLRSKGVRSAKAGPRNIKDVPQMIEVRGPASRESDLLAAVTEIVTAPSKACK